MAVRFVGIDPETGKDQSPTVWVDDEQGDLIVQSYTADQGLITAVLKAGHGPDHDNVIPAHETVIRIPARLVPLLRKACDVAEGSELL
ncbi:hypothetical protein BX285_2958 [Streptomyces sp. 1114.5]|uniref:hypothetical protein n=1 Tax=unclassified Streptomyces TaxID=2593676 RepID=UPI000BD362CE|nr:MULTISPECIES: hypothetical protein [unclassified Streptomyces]RKT18530.1 hypothetical protein BX285_2958 [Streptomyces sp. 1114.5]SOB84731.1 hypothetical protein SAMN06272789_4991 [Streptomyces sp. 1331.2]